MIIDIYYGDLNDKAKERLQEIFGDDYISDDMVIGILEVEETQEKLLN